jgi:hypothetical protein
MTNRNAAAADSVETIVLHIANKQGRKVKERKQEGKKEARQDVDCYSVVRRQRTTTML